MTLQPTTYNQSEKAILIGTQRPDQERWDSEDLVNELQRLTETAGAQPIMSIIQAIQRPDPAYFIGSGKVEEIATLCQSENIGLAIFNDNLSPVQQKNLENRLQKKVVDRTGLILDIFAQRALSKEGKLQVELAQLQYMLPRLTRMWTHLSRLGGGIGTRGPGETQLETDRRRIKTRISKIKKGLKNVSKHRLQHRRSRQDVPIPVVAMVGYTNSGKSTLFQQLTGTPTFIEDKLFATLDPLIRPVTLSNQQKILLLDTVGFIRELPTQLVAAFKATLEEIQSAELLLHVIDISHPNALQHIETVERIIIEMGIQHLPIIKVFNKIDLLPEQVSNLGTDHENRAGIHLSALHSQGLDQLIAAIPLQMQKFRKKMNLTIPYLNKEAINYLRRHGTIIEEEYNESSMVVMVEIDSTKAEKLKRLVSEGR
ncbi:GTPase HflX [candidate division CSSED10-310 bacterium]|uniref:GTPase HflX n=1 Tax=candidate division CSSED10-310 bacterium TaxID=2855610 RepID=A0ABV6YW92_UNCC1